MLSLSLRDFLIDDSGAEVVEFAIIIASFTVITLTAVSYLGSTAAANVNNDASGLSNGALTPP